MAGEVEGNVPEASVESKINLVKLRERVRSYIDKVCFEATNFCIVLFIYFSHLSCDNLNS